MTIQEKIIQINREIVHQRGVLVHTQNKSARLQTELSYNENAVKEAERRVKSLEESLVAVKSGRV